jgi:hypothetical protein
MLLHEFLSYMLVVRILICVCLNWIYVLLTKLCWMFRILSFCKECIYLEFGTLY